jgi:hypothetical protein
LLGVLVKRLVLVWCFCGGIVVICVVDVVFFSHFLVAEKYANFFNFIFWVRLLRCAGVLPDGPLRVGRSLRDFSTFFLLDGLALLG